MAEINISPMQRNLAFEAETTPQAEAAQMLFMLGLMVVIAAIRGLI